jgi:NADP-dependent 3-hydroxy acid dehydrogenase YdfG
LRTPTKGDDSGDPKAGGCRVVPLNALGVPYASHAAVHHMLDRGSGDVVIVSSLADRRVPKTDGTVYASTNHALTAVAKGLIAVCTVIEPPSLSKHDPLLGRPLEQGLVCSRCGSTSLQVAVRMDVSARGVRVINVEPGLVRTEFPEGSF